jgi:hypothetical protein
MGIPGFSAENTLRPPGGRYRTGQPPEVLSRPRLAFSLGNLCWAQCFGNCELLGGPALECDYMCQLACGGGGPVPTTHAPF